MMDNVERRLVTILAADMVGYSNLILDVGAAAQ